MNSQDNGGSSNGYYVLKERIPIKFWYSSLCFNQIFPQRWCKQTNYVKLSPRLQDMTPMEFFYWLFKKLSAYNLFKVEYLENEIR